ncbi:GUN4 domain-containing protein [Nostoc sp. CHAB 5844]|nr:GUN4 domain-containing protein [Nostoc sp. CHAB 5844]
MDQYGIDELRQSMIKVLDSKSEQVVGSGFVIHSDGYLVTCHHVIYFLDWLRVVYQGKIYEAKWCEELSNPEVDIAILKIEVANAKAVRIIEPYTLDNPALIYGFPRSKLEKFPEGFDVPAQNIEPSVPLSTRRFFPITKHSSLTNPWNRLPETTSTFQSYRIRKSVDAGTSGGPVLVNVLRGVIGVVQCSSKEETYIIRWENIKEKLEILGIGVQKQEICQDVSNTNLEHLNSNFKEEYIKLLSNISSRVKSNSISSKRLDFTKLKTLLEALNFKEADIETDHLILRAVNKARHNLITSKDLSKLDFSIIYDIDCLWMKYSEGKFGFIVQQVIWNMLNNQSNKFDLHILAESVGWLSNDKWLDYNQFTFSLEAQEGHLPSFGYNMQPLHDWISSYNNFFSYVRNHLQ